MALRLAALAASKPTAAEREEERANSPRRRGWDASSGNPRFQSDSGEWDHLIMSPRNEKLKNNGYQQVSPPVRRRIDEDAAFDRNAPLDFDRPHPKVLAAIAATRAAAKLRLAEGGGAPMPTPAPAKAVAAKAAASARAADTPARPHRRRRPTTR